MHRLGHAGATISALKLFVCVPEVVLLGHKCSYKGCLPDDSKVAKIRDWPACETFTEVHAFLGTCGTMNIWIPGYSEIMCLLNDLLQKDTDFLWTEVHDRAMQTLKHAICNSPALLPLDYHSS